MKNFVKAMFTYFVASAMSVIGMLGGAWLWGEVLEPKASEFKERHQK